MPFRPGDIVGGRYELIGRLGEGAFGEVWKANQIRIGRQVAIKLLKPEAATNRDAVLRFTNEAQAAGKLAHENIVAILDAGAADDGTPYIVMELLEGIDLATHLARHGPLSVPQAEDIILQVCSGLALVHASGILHRDLKPANLFLVTRERGLPRVKILDFGIAKLHAGATHTATGDVIGSPLYMSPEQWLGQKDIDRRADVYALGVILYELLSGQLPFAVGDTLTQSVRHVLQDAPRALRSVRRDLPPGLTSIVHRAFSRARDARFPSVQDLARAIETRAPGIHDLLLGKYRLIAELGRGGMGIVWHARAEHLQRDCAIKLLRPNALMQPGALERIDVEARAAARLVSPHIVTIHDVDRHRQLPFIAMELLQGPSLSAYLDAHPGALPAHFACELVRQVASALSCAHQNGLIHRDLKPGNIILVSEAPLAIKILDFGIARFAEPGDGSADQAAARSLSGTPPFMSPERFDGGAPNPLCDTWALGVLAFRCLTGRLPFDGPPVAVLSQLALGQIPSITGVNPALPAAVQHWWQRATHRSKAERFQSAQELARALHEALFCGAHASPPSARESLLPAPSPVPAAAPVPASRALGIPLWALAVAFPVIAMLSTLHALFGRSDRAAERRDETPGRQPRASVVLSHAALAHAAHEASAVDPVEPPAVVDGPVVDAGSAAQARAVADAPAIAEASAGLHAWAAVSEAPTVEDAPAIEPAPAAVVDGERDSRASAADNGAAQPLRPSRTADWGWPDESGDSAPSASRRAAPERKRAGLPVVHSGERGRD